MPRQDQPERIAAPSVKLTRRRVFHALLGVTFIGLLLVGLLVAVFHVDPIRVLIVAGIYIAAIDLPLIIMLVTFAKHHER
jgi:hypothetical protein